MADAWDDENAPEPTDEDAPEDEEQDDDRETLRGLVTDWENPKGNAPAKLKIAGTKAQVWPYAYGDEDKDEYSDTFKTLKRLAIEDGAVEAVGEYKSRTFHSDKAKKDITTTTFTVYEADEIDKTPEMKTAAQAAKAAVKGSGKGGGKSQGNGKQYGNLTKEEWAEKDRVTSAKIRSAWATETACTLLVAAKPAEAPELAKIEALALQLVKVADKVQVAILASPSSTSDSAAASPSTTSEPEPPSAPAPKEKARSKASAKPKAD